MNMVIVARFTSPNQNTQTMYRLGEREHKHHKLYIFFGVFGVIIIIALFAAKHFLTSETKLDNTGPAIVTDVSYEQTKLQAVDAATFTMKIPASWKLSSIVAEDPRPSYIWQGTVAEDKNRWISVYVDKQLANFAVNRAIHILANGSNLSVIGSTSDNCTSFTGVTGSTTGKSPAKWESIDFICDSGNYQRDVVGTVSPDGLNNINIAGTLKGPHRYFFTYTDNSNQPDYTIFSEALRSFKAK